MYRIGVVTGTRAEYGLLKPLIEKINKDSELELYFIVTGAHLEEKFGNTYRDILQDGYLPDRIIPMNLTSDEARGICLSMSKELAGFADAFAENDLDLLFLLGDRYEALIAAVAAMMFRIPIAHLHGGELTEGLIDDAIRHSISKMSSIHFTSTQTYAKRLRQMGERAERIFPVGALGVENIKKIRLLSREELCGRYGHFFAGPYVLITYHPVTLDNNMAETQFRILLQVISARQDYHYVFTYANADAEGSRINQLIDTYVGTHKNACAFQSMGQIGYLSALKYAVCVAGNSSSGIIEAPSFHIPTINIGSRQKGRVCAQTVISCGSSISEIEEAFEKATSKDFAEGCKDFCNPYEGDNTSEKIIEITKRILKEGIELKKSFIDLQVT